MQITVTRSLILIKVKRKSNESSLLISMRLFDLYDIHIFYLWYVYLYYCITVQGYNLINDFLPDSSCHRLEEFHVYK